MLCCKKSFYNCAVICACFNLCDLGWLDPELPQLLDLRYDLLPDEEWNGRAVSVIRDRRAEVPVLHYLDVETALEVRRTATIVDDVDGEHLVEVIFAEPAADLAVAFPSGYECRLDGRTVHSVKFIQYEFDKWMPEVLFERKDQSR